MFIRVATQKENLFLAKFGGCCLNLQNSTILLYG